MKEASKQQIFGERIQVGFCPVYCGISNVEDRAQELLKASGRHDLRAVLDALERLDEEDNEEEVVDKKQVLSVADSDGNTLLHRCVLGPDECSEASTDPEPEDGLRIVELLVQARVNVDSENMLGETPLVSAVRAASSHGVVNALLVARADPGCRDMLTGETALMEAACSGDVQLCRMLLEFKADPAQQNTQGLTALDLALAAGSSSVAELPGMTVVAEEIPDQAVTARGPDTLRAAIKAGDFDGVIAELEEIGGSASAVLQSTDGSGRTMLHLCALNLAARDTPSIVQALVRYSVQVDSEDAFGRTALEVAVETSCSGQMQTNIALPGMRSLLDARADPRVVKDWRTEGTALNSAAGTPLGAAICELLNEFGASLDDMLSQATADKSCEQEDDEVIDCMEAETPSDEVSNERFPNASRDSPEVESTPSVPASQRAGGLRQRCEAYGIPFDTLGTFSAADVLRERERQQALSLNDLCEECKGSVVQDECERLVARGLPADELKTELLSRLQQVRVWKVMPMSALQTECRLHASHVVDTAHINPGKAMERSDMIEALAVASWGGSTRNQQLLDTCAKKGIPVDKLESLERAAKLLESVNNLDTRSLFDLRNIYRQKGFAPVRNMSKEELVSSMAEVLIWEDLPLSALRDVCKEKHVQTKGDQRRADLMELLASSTWEARGIPILRLPSANVAHEIFDKVEHFEAAGIEELRAECKRHQLPFSALGNKEDLVACLTAITVWEEFSVDELYAACMERNVNAGADHKSMLAGLGESLFQCLLRDRGIQERQLGRQKTEQLFNSIGNLESLDLASLKEECKKLGIPPEADIDRKEYVSRITRMMVWSSLSFEDLRKECRAADVATSGLNLKKGEDSQRRELVERLFLNLVRASWEAKGIPVRRLGGCNLAVVARVVERKEKLAQMLYEELCKEYEQLGLPIDASVSLGRQELQKRLTNVCIWKELPTKELQKEARNVDVSTNGMSHRTDADQRSELVERLTVGMCLEAWEASGIPVRRFCTVQAASKVVERVLQLEAMSDKDLAKEYYSIGLPPSASKDPSYDQMLSRLKYVARWRQLSLKELRRECSDNDVPNVIPSVTMSEEEQAAELVDRLIMNSCADAWAKRGIPMQRFSNIQSSVCVVNQLDRLAAMNFEELNAEYLKLGLPAEADVPEDPVEVEERLRLIACWREFPLRELQKECQKRDVPTSGASSNTMSDTEMRQELTERLVLVLCADGLEARGIPIRKIRTIRAACAVVREFAHLDGLSSESVKEEYLKLNLPAEVEMPEQHDEMLSRLKQVAVWKHLPLHELRKKCQEFGVSGVGDEHPQMVQRVVSAAWAPRRPPSPRSGSAGQQRSSFRPGQTSWDSQWDFRHDSSGAGGQRRHQWSHLFGPRDRAAPISKHFKTMGLPPTATSDDLKKAYRNLALKYHPDKNVGLSPEDAAAKFREVKEAHEALVEHFKQRAPTKRP